MKKTNNEPTFPSLQSFRAMSLTKSDLITAVCILIFVLNRFTITVSIDPHTEHHRDHGEHPEITVVTKCCPLNQELFNKTCRGTDQGFQLEINPELEREFVVGYINCSWNKVPVLISAQNDEEGASFNILKTGQLEVLKGNVTLTFNVMDYCVDRIDGELQAVLCITNDLPPSSTYTGKVVLVIDLFLIFLQYGKYIYQLFSMSTFLLQGF